MGCPGLGIALAALKVAEPVVGLGVPGVEDEHLAVLLPHLGKVGFGKCR